MDTDKWIDELEFGTVFVFSDQKEYYLDRYIIKAPEQDALLYRSFRVKLGTYQDEVICKAEEYPDFDFRFFPYQKQRLKFFSWSGHFKPVWLCNEGEKDLEVDTPFGIFLVPGKSCCLCSRENREYQIDAPLVPAIDKHNVNDVYVKGNRKVGYGRPNDHPDIIEIDEKEKS
jgi:hypothetical protein